MLTTSKHIKILPISRKRKMIHQLNFMNLEMRTPLNLNGELPIREKINISSHKNYAVS